MKDKMRNLTEREKFCLDAFVSNGNMEMAWMLSREKPSTSTNPDIIRRMALRWMRDKSVKKYIADQRKQILSSLDDSSGELSDYQDKNFILSQYVRQLKITTDPKLRAEMLWKISELQNMRKKEEETKDSTIHYYLPLACNNCSLYAEHEKALQARE